MPNFQGLVFLFEKKGLVFLFASQVKEESNKYRGHTRR
jgi:hypothetical protein